jgi:MFS family permease
MIQNYLAFAIVYALFLGTGAALAGVLPCQSLAIRLFPRHVGKISGLLMVALAITGVVLPVVVTPFMLAVGWRTALAVAGAIILVLIPLLAFGFMRERAPVAAGAADVPAAAPAPAGGFMRTRGFWIILAGIFPMMATSTAVQANLLPILADHGVGPRDASFILSGLAVGSALGAALFGWLADRADPRLVLGAAVGLMAASLVAFAGSGGLPVAAGATVVLGLAGGGLLPLMSIFAFRQFGAAYAPAYGLLNSFMLPYMLAPPLIGLVRDKTGSYTAAFLGAVPLLLLSAAVVWLLRTSPGTRASALMPHPGAAA